MKVKYKWQEFMADIEKTPNWLTFSRIVGFFFLLLPLLLSGYLAVAFAVFLLLAMTDLFDGELARRKNIVTWLGKGIDPIADKIFLIGTMFLLGLFKVYPVLGISLITFESALLVMGIITFLSKDERFALGANSYGKIKAILEVTIISLLFIDKLNVFPVHSDFILFLFWAAICYALLSILGHLGLLELFLPQVDSIS